MNLREQSLNSEVIAGSSIRILNRFIRDNLAISSYRSEYFVGRKLYSLLI